MRFKTVLDEMRQQDIVGNLRQLGDEVKKENGLSIAACEYWSDTSLDRWAEDLVDPASSPAPCGNAKSKSSLPPALGAGGSFKSPGRRGQPSVKKRRAWPSMGKAGDRCCPDCTSSLRRTNFSGTQQGTQRGRVDAARRSRFRELPDGRQ